MHDHPAQAFVTGRVVFSVGDLTKMPLRLSGDILCVHLGVVMIVACVACLACVACVTFLCRRRGMLGMRCMRHLPVEGENAEAKKGAADVCPTMPGYETEQWFEGASV